MTAVDFFHSTEIVAGDTTQAVKAIEAIMSLEIILALMQNEEEETRVILLKLLDVLLRSSQLRLQFAKMKGWALLGDLLKPFSVSEELLAVLFAMLLGKPTHAYNAPNVGPGISP